MLASERKRMCPYCEGEVDYESTYCPLCGGELEKKQEQPDLAEMRTEEKHRQLEESLATLYRPPYSGSSYQRPPEPAPTTHTHQIFHAEEEESDVDDPTQMTEADGGIWPLLFLTIGGMLLTLGLLLFFFSENGRVILEWNAHYWFLYCLIATPFLMLGWKFLNPSQESNE